MFQTVYTNGERGTRMHRAIFSTKQISGVVTLVILNCLHEQGAVTHRRLTILGLRYIVLLREEINGKRRKNCGVSR